MKLLITKDLFGLLGPSYNLTNSRHGLANSWERSLQSLCEPGMEIVIP